MLIRHFDRAAHGYPLSGSISRPNDAALFRTEALAEQHTATEGRIVLIPRLSMTLVALAAMAVAASVITALMLGSYTRRATVTGQLVPTAGVLKVHTPQAGVVLEKRVIEGQRVNKGDIMFVLGSDRLGAGARDLQADIGSQIGADLSRGCAGICFRRSRGAAFADLRHANRMRTQRQIAVNRRPLVYVIRRSVHRRLGGTN